MTGFGKEYKSQKKRNIKNNSSNEKIINQAINLHLQGNISEAEKSESGPPIDLSTIKCFSIAAQSIPTDKKAASDPIV